MGAENNTTAQPEHRDGVSSRKEALEKFGRANRAHDLIGMSVKNGQNEKLGKVNDLIVDLPTSHIVGVILSTGGILGAGSKDLLVPPAAFTSDAADKTLRLMADKNKLTAAPEFDAKKWEEGAQDASLTGVYEYYGQPPYHAWNEPTVHNHNLARRAAYERASKLIGMQVRNSQDEKVGKVEDLVVSLESSRVHEVIVAAGGFLGLGDEYSAVPPSSFGFNAQRDALQLNVTKEAMKNAPHFKANEWPNFEDPNYVNGVNRSYNVDNTGRNVRDRNGQSVTPTDQGNDQADLKVTQQIRREIVGRKELSVTAKNIKVITVNGHVTLRGPVKTAEEKRIISEITDRVARPENVDNQLEVNLTTSN